MKNKIKQILDNRATWLVIGSFAGTLLGEKAALIVQGIGSLVMTIIV